jgi:hypothetical protein
MCNDDTSMIYTIALALSSRHEKTTEEHHVAAETESLARVRVVCEVGRERGAKQIGQAARA